ncbi:hypothetical protein KCU96_g9683, partial [Aureobasidium melanogenum]
MDPPLTVASDWHSNRNQFEPLAHLQDHKSRWFANRQSRRRRAREHKRKELMEFQLATLDADLSTRFDHVIRTNEHNSSVQLPDLDLPPMQMIKWQPPAYSPVVTPAPRLQRTPDAEWSSLEIKFSPPVKKASAVPCPSPPMSLMTAAEFGLLTPLTPKVCLPELNNGSQDAVIVSVDASTVKPWMSAPPTARPVGWDSYVDPPGDANVASSFVAAKLPHFRDIDPFDLTMPSTPDVNPSKYDYSKSPSQATRCTLYHGKDDHEVERTSLTTSQSLRSCEKGRMPGLIHNESTSPHSFALDVDWSNEPVVDWPYDVVGDWNDEPFLDWNGEPVADWVNEPIDDCFDDLVMIEHDAETFDWTFLSRYKALSDCASTLSSASSSMEVLPLPLRDSFMEERSAYEEPIRELAESAHEEPVRELAEEELNMRRVSKSAWESETDFCIPAFF